MEPSSASTDAQKFRRKVVLDALKAMGLCDWTESNYSLILRAMSDIHLKDKP